MLYHRGNKIGWRQKLSDHILRAAPCHQLLVAGERDVAEGQDQDQEQ